jgi:hypothetical protein
MDPGCRILEGNALPGGMADHVDHGSRIEAGFRSQNQRLDDGDPANVTAPSDLKRIYTACVARGAKLPITFTVGAHPLDFVAATMRQGGDELALIAQMRGEPAALVKSLTNDIRVPADAEMTLEGYLDERGYVEPEGPYGEYMGYYEAIHMDPVFHCTAITGRLSRSRREDIHGRRAGLGWTVANYHRQVPGPIDGEHSRQRLAAKIARLAPGETGDFPAGSWPAEPPLTANERISAG